MRNVLLITSTVAPATDTYRLVRKDPELRLADYMASLKYQMGLIKSGAVDSIVYADNSGFPLDQLKDICERAGVKDKIEFISSKSDTSPRLGRYFLEIELIKWAMSASRLLSAEEDLRIWKLTGRYIITNIYEIITQVPECDLYINCRDYPIPWADFFLVAFTKRGYREILELDLSKFKDTENGENALREMIDAKSFPNCRIVKRFIHTPRVLGIRGLDGAHYAGWGGSVKYGLRAMANKIVPILWI
jgi:hypothetical protein